MNSKRKADIQRKLSLTAVPRPPDDLLDRIKSDIPNYLSVEAERARFSRSIGFNLRIAASIIILISIAGALYVVTPTKTPNAVVAIQRPKQTPAPTASATDEVRLDIVQAAPAVQIADGRVAPPPSPAVPRPEVVGRQALLRMGEEQRRNEVMSNAGGVVVEDGVEGSVPGGVAGGTAGGVIGGNESRDREYAQPAAAPAPLQMAESAPAPVPAPSADSAYAPEPPPPPATAAAETRAMAKTARTAGASLVPPAYADDLDLAPKSVFGISVDPSAFRKIRATIESGARPSPASVDVEALVNYFAGAPARRVRGVRLEAEGSPPPVGANGHRAILRLTIDTGDVSVPEGGSVPPIAKDALLEIDFDREAVERIDPIGDSGTLVRENVLLHNVSVTGLYALDLRTPLQPKQRVATIRLTYRSVEDGKKHTIVREVRGSEFAKKQWASASRRHRLASLGALWGESLRSSSGGTDVARRAEELASQAPNDERARELKEVAVASSGGGGTR